MPAEYDITIWIGNDEQKVFTFKDSEGTAVDLTGSSLVFRSVNIAGVEVIRRELVLDTLVNGKASLQISASDTRLFAANAPVRYEIERRVAGVQTTLAYGTMILNGGINDD